MSDFGFAAHDARDQDHPGLGWSLDAQGQIVRASSVADKMRRLLRPFFGAVALEGYRGAPDRALLKKRVDAAPVICQDRARLLLKPMTSTGEITNLSVKAILQGEFIALVITALDANKQPITLTEFVRIP